MTEKLNTFLILLGFIVGEYFGFAFLAFFIFPVGAERTIDFRLLPPKVQVQTLFLSVVILGLFGLLGAAGAYAFGTKRSLKESVRKLGEALEVNKTKDEFISMVLHHLRTPLAGIKWSLKEILKGFTESDLRRGDLELLFEENERALRAVDHLVEASQANLGRIAYNLEVIPVGELIEIVQSAIEALRASAREKELELLVSLPEISPNAVKVDKEKIGIIVQTLLENAIQFTQPGGSISIKTEERDYDFLFHISDTGAGIPIEDQPRIFLQFFRTANARRLVPGGFGVGLFIAKIFLQNQGGAIWFTSEEGKGSTFSFRLPIIRTKTEKFLEEIQ